MKSKKGIVKRVSCVMALLLAFQSGGQVESFAADINNITEPVYKVQKNAEGNDVFVYAYNVMDFGADNTGNNDNTQIFQKLIDKTSDMGGGIIYIPSGMYKVTGSLRIKKGVTLYGDWKEPKKGQNLPEGTVLMAYVGRNRDEEGTPFMETEVEVGITNLTIWYPEQQPDNIVQYSPTIRLGCDWYFGNEYANVKNVTLVNSYIGIWWNRHNGGASPVINGVYGTPLYKGIEIDCIADVGRIENAHFSPSYWADSDYNQVSNKKENIKNWLYENAIGIVMRRNDWSYTCYVDVEGYNVGYCTRLSSEGNGATPNGHHYKFKLTDCKTGIKFETSNYVGILFDDINCYKCETGVRVEGNTTDTIQFANSKFTCTKYAINIDKTSSTKFMLYDSQINAGVVYAEGGTLAASSNAFNNKQPQIVVGNLGRMSLSGNSFKNEKQVINNSIYNSNDSNADFESEKVPVFDDDKAKFKSHMPKKTDLFIVTKAPYNADNSKNHGGGNDCTQAIQNALNDAKNNGGGIVFMPAGHYRVNGSIIIPEGVELRGATDLSTVPHGSGAIIEAYGNRNNPSGAPLIKIAANAGIRGVIFNYPEQTFNLNDNGEFRPVDYPATMQGLGENVYVINVGIRAATWGIDFDTYRCDNHYVDFLAGHINKCCVKVGNNSKNGIINNLMFNTIIYACGREYPKFGGFPNSPDTPNGQSNSAVYDQQLRDLEFLVVGDTKNETLYNCFPYGAFIGIKFINEGNGGADDFLSMGLGIDGSRKSVYFEKGLTGKLSFINNQIVSLNNDQPITRYFEAESNSNFKADFYNTDLWGYPEKSVVMGENSGDLNLYIANFQMRGYNVAFDVKNGSDLKLINSSANNNGQFSTNSNNLTVINSVMDYTASEGNNFKQNINNLSTGVSVNGNSGAMSQLDRSGWSASSNVNNHMANLSIDGNLESQWNSLWQAPGQWYQLDMGREMEFDTIITTLGHTNDSPGIYKVLLSKDGNNWETVDEGENQSVYTFDKKRARYIRIEQSSSAGKYWAIFEIYVLNSTNYVANQEIIEDETVVNDNLKIEGIQISYTLKGLRAISSIEQTINNKKVVESGNIYGLGSEGVKEDDLVLNSSDNNVASFKNTNIGLLQNYQKESATANYYAMTMLDNGTTAAAYNCEYIVRPYVILEDGEVVYGESCEYTIYRVAKFLYDNYLMNNKNGHDYLYNDILKVVDRNYIEIPFDYRNILVKPNM
ncbi:MAG: discoidin domain-containing protein [Lachnospiraceae bacterium]|nr:discoidin domain-containing protein [Lachnospiraceae bacterium]